MDRISTSLAICFCAALALSFAVFFYPSSAIGEQAAQESSILPAAGIRVDAILVELDGVTISEIEKSVGFKLGADDDHVILTQEQKEKLLAAIEENAGARIIATSGVQVTIRQRAAIELRGNLGSSAEPAGAATDTGHGIYTSDWSDLLSPRKITIVNGETGKVEVVQEISYPTQYDTETIDVGGSGTTTDPASDDAIAFAPFNRDGRKVSVVIKVVPAAITERRIAMVVTQETSVLTGWKKTEEPDEIQPLFRTWDKTTSLIVPDGSCFILREPLLKALYPSQPPGVEAIHAEQVAAPEEPSAQKKEILKKLETIIPEVRFEDAKLTEIVDFLSREAGVTVVIDPAVFQGYTERFMGLEGTTIYPGGVTPIPAITAPGITPGIGETTAPGHWAPPPADTGVTIHLKNVPLKEALKYILSYKKLKYLAEDYAILIAPQDYVPPESLETEIFRLTRGVDGVQSADTEGSQQPESAESEAITDFLRNSGVPWPKGSNVLYNEKSGTLVVTNTPSNMVLIRELVVVWSDPSQRAKLTWGRQLLTIVSARIVGSK